MAAKKAGPGGPDDPLATPDRYRLEPRGSQGDDRDLWFKLGSLTKEVETIRETQNEIRTDLAKVTKRVSTARTIVWLVGVVVIAVVGFAAWLITSAIALLPSILSRAKP
jgi:hypothetical protein